MGLKQYTLENIFIKRPTISEYPRLEPEVKDLVDLTIKENLKPNPVLRVPMFLYTRYAKAVKTNLWKLSWGDLVLLREAVSAQDILEVFKMIYGITPKQFARLDVFNVFAVYKWIIDQLHDIHEKESIMLPADFTQEEKDAGAEDLLDFGYTVAVDTIAGGDLLKHKEVLKIQYDIIFRKLCLDKKRNDINKTYQENASRKNRGNS